MSKLKISENLFLEVNELQRLVHFLEEDGYKRLMKSLVRSYGIVQNTNNDNFKVTLKAGSVNTVIINPGLAFDSNLNAIIMTNAKEMVINNTGVKRWLILSRAITNLETGTVSVNAEGVLTGIGTEFTKILRGQPNFPVKVKFNSVANTGEYEVVSVISDTSAILAGSLVAENTINFSVIGTFTPGFQPLEANRQIYEYDYHNIDLVDSVDTPILADNQYILASIQFDALGVISVSDRRTAYLFNNPYSQSDNSDSSYENSLASLVAVNKVGGVNAVGSVSVSLEAILEHGYTVSAYELTVSSSSNIFTITNGSCNFLGTGNIPNSMFKGWILLNRKNMKSCKIDNNINKAVYISNFDTSVLNNGNIDFVIVPNFKEIEYEIKLSNNVNMTEIPFRFKNSIANVKNRMQFYALFPSISPTFVGSISISIKYRMLDDSGRQYPFYNLSVAQFVNIKGISETLAGSAFNVNLAEIVPVAAPENYS